MRTKKTKNKSTAGRRAVAKRSHRIETRNMTFRKMHPRKKRRGPSSHILAYISYSALVIIFIATILYVLLYSPFLEIKKVEFSGIESLSEAELRSVTGQYLDHRLYGVLPQSNLVAFSADQYEQHLPDNFKKIEIVSVEKVFPDTLLIEIQERYALLVWCSGGPCSVIDDQGVATAPIDLDSSLALQNDLRQIIDRSGRLAEMDNAVLDKDAVAYYKQLPDSFYLAIGIRIEKVFTVPSRAAEEYEVMTEEGWRLYGSTKLSIEYLVRILNSLFEQNIDPAQRQELEYIDLRSKNKAFYVLKGSDENVEEVSLEDSGEEKRISEDDDE